MVTLATVVIRDEKFRRFRRTCAVAVDPLPLVPGHVLGVSGQLHALIFSGAVGKSFDSCIG